MSWQLVGADGQCHPSAVAGTLGGHRRGRRYGRLDCPAALRALRRGGYVADRVFFLDESTAVAAGYRPCASCLPDAYRRWRAGSGASRTAQRGICQRGVGGLIFQATTDH